MSKDFVPSLRTAESERDGAARAAAADTTPEPVDYVSGREYNGRPAGLSNDALAWPPERKAERIAFTMKNGTADTIVIDRDAGAAAALNMRGQVIGTAELGANAQSGKPLNHAASVFVDGAYRRQGVATAMYDALGVEQPSPLVSPDSIGLWRSRGWYVDQEGNRRRLTAE